MTLRIFTHSYRSFLTAVLVVSCVTCALAGSAGVRNGAIRGTVTDVFGTPLEGVSVVAVRSETPASIRNATTDASGRFVMTGVYLGSYTIGYSKYGYQVVDTSTGNNQNPTPTGPQARVYVDSGQTSLAPTMRLRPLPDTSNGTVNVTLLDASSAAPVTDGSVFLGLDSRTSGTPEGLYTLSTPAEWDEQAGRFKAQNLNASADGFNEQIVPVTVMPRQKTEVTVRLVPFLASISGTVVTAVPRVDLSKVAIRVRNLSPQYSSVTISPTGEFVVGVPASTASLTRRFTIDFILPNFKTAVVTGVTAPLAGTVTLPQPVKLDAEMVDVTGQVVVSTGGTPQGSAYDQVVVTEFGQATSIAGGTYLIKLPSGQTVTLKFTAKNPNGGALESAETTVTPTSDGSQAPVFHIPTVITRP